MMTRIKTLVFGGGEIHDWQGIQPKLLETLQAEKVFDLEAVQEDLDALIDLTSYDVMVFHYTVGNITAAQRDGLSHWLATGRGLVGIHSAADSFRSDPDFRNLLGGYFITHPRYRQYQVSVKDPDHPIMEGIDEDFMVEDEQYILNYDPRVNVLATALWKGETMPVAWTKSHGRGRIFYQALGHDTKACQHSAFKQMLVQGTIWAAQRLDESKV